MTDAALHVLDWYLALALIGAYALLPAAVLCDRLHTRGVLLARPLGLALVALVVWVIGWFGWVHYDTPLVILVVVALAAWSASIAWRRPEVLRAVIERRRIILAGEALCLVVFALVLLARSQAPLAVATEKPMDLMIITAVHEADRFPPRDPWLAGYDLSYYHLGHLSADILGRLSGNVPGVAFNLAAATAGALAAVALAGLAADVLALGRGGTAVPRRAMIVAGGVAVVTLLLITPLVGLVNLAAANGIGDLARWAALGVEGVPIRAGAESGIPTAFWWWWTSTRVLPGTISEFPAFTLLLGDPHAHLLALPIDLVAVAHALATFEGGTPLTWRRWLMTPERLFLTGAVFAAVFMTNAWDIVVYGGLWGAAAILAFRRTGWSWLPAVVGAVRWAMAPIGVAAILAIGFFESLDTPLLGLAAVAGEHSDPVHWLLIWLPPLTMVLVPLALLRPRVERDTVLRVLPLVALPLAAWIGVVLNTGGLEEFAARGSGWMVILALLAVISAVVAAAMHADARIDRALSAALALLAVALIVLLGTELFRVADAFPGRLNTVFKFWFNVWVLVAAAAGALAGLAWERGSMPAHAVARRAMRLGLPVALTATLLTSLYVPAMAISRAREGQPPGLHGTTHLQRDDPGLHATIEWSRGRLDPRRDVMLQAVSESYTAGNMLSAATGIPTLLGWPNHQRQWRRSIPEGERRTEVDALYRGGATPANVELARRLGVTYVYVGVEERVAYGTDVAARFAAWPAVVNSGGALLVKVP